MKKESTLRPSLPAKSLFSMVEMLPSLPIKRSTVWSWTKTGRFPAPVHIGRLTRWRYDDVNNWLNQYMGDGNDC